jgi:predicted ribosomally synthesized peptide with SipW-like signal peptide
VHEPSSGRVRRRGLALALVAAALLTAGGVASSLAIFTDTETVDGNAFTTGSIQLSAAPATALLTASALMPGDSVNGTLVLSNAGTAQLRYAMTASTTNADGLGLASQLALAVRTQGTSCAAFDGTLLYSGAIGSAAFGSPSAGAQAGDRTLAGATSETLCFRASLPLATGVGYQNASTTATFTFAAEQTANNP